MKKLAKSPIFVRADSGKNFKENFFQRKPIFPGKIRLDLQKSGLTNLMKKVVRKSWKLRSEVENDLKKYDFF